MKLTTVCKKLGIGFLALLGLAILALIFSNLWGSYQYHKITHSERWQNMVQRITEIPKGNDLLDSQLLKKYLLAETSPLISGDYLNPETYSEIYTDSNALSLWMDRYSNVSSFLSVTSEKVTEKYAKEQDSASSSQSPPKNRKPRPGSLETTELPNYSLQLEHIQTRIAEIEASTNSARNVVTNRADLQIYLDEWDRKTIQKMLPEWNSYLTEFNKTTASTEAYAAMTPDQQAAALLLGFRKIGDETYELLKQCVEESSFIDASNNSSELEIASLFFMNVLPKHIAIEASARAALYARLGMKAEALSELGYLFHLSELKRVPSDVVSGLIAILIQTHTCETIHRFILEGTLTDEELLSIQSRLNHWNPLGYLALDLEGDSFGVHNTFIKERRIYGKPPLIGVLLRYVIPGILRMNEAELIQMCWDFGDCIDTQQQVLDNTRWNAALKRGGIIRSILANENVGGMNHVDDRWLRIQSTRDVTILGCALERYYLKNGRYPEKLEEELVPTYLETMPIGWNKQGTLTYKLDGTGYELISNKDPNRPEPDKMSVTWKR
ncbi:MAG: hypothetical protein M0Q48_08570 [Verrucomicrobia bacterium]|nr:hypothetical protein [Verrucomicrobiota bacterium]